MESQRFGWLLRDHHLLSFPQCDHIQQLSYGDFGPTSDAEAITKLPEGPASAHQS